MRLYRDEAVVLRTQKLGEADRIITLLTRHHGRVRASAKGVRRTSSRFGARLEPFMHVDLQLYEGRSLDTVTQAVTLGPYGGMLTNDYGAYVAAAAIAETAERVTEAEREPATQQFLLVVGALRTLAAKTQEPSLVLDAYLLRALSVAGWAISLTDCAGCGSPGPHRAFSVPAGGSVCPQCRPPGSAAPHPATLSLMSALLTGDWDAANASQAPARRESSGLIAAHLQWNLERGVRSLAMVERS